jgi:hypothetical protein
MAAKLAAGLQLILIALVMTDASSLSSLVTHHGDFHP